MKDKNNWSKRGEKIWKKGNVSFIKTKMAIYSILYCSVMYFNAVIISKLMRPL